jgi:peptide/nickel transport system substrate-binding protein
MMLAVDSRRTESHVDAHTKALAHGELAANWPMDGLKIAERWWFA